MNQQKIVAVPTNIITGFLGAGKTSAILHLLKQKPTNERWAILVNEFGEIGVDGSLIAGQVANDENIFIREVPGGCMCCASGVPMQIALNQLLKEARPDRLLIEPTGLGHPHEVLQVLSNKYYQDTLSLEKTITLVDARNLKDTRYTEHVIFNQQIDIADIVVGSKSDLYQTEDQQKLIDYVNKQPSIHEQSPADKSTVFIEHGKLPYHLLAGNTQYQRRSKLCHHNHPASNDKNLEPLPESGFVVAINQGEGFESIGWRINHDKIFDYTKLNAFLASLNISRLKAVFNTSEGAYGYNIVDDNISEVKLTELDESRIEIICQQVNDDWQQQLLSLID